MIEVWSDGSNTGDGQRTRMAWIIKQDGHIKEKGVRDGGPGWSDVAEYKAVQLGLKRLISRNLSEFEIVWRLDSQFIVNQIKRQWPLEKEKPYINLARQVRRLLHAFPHITFVWVPREDNKEADALATLRRTK